MCCRGRQQGHTPAVVTAGRAIYNAYQNHHTASREYQREILPPLNTATMQQPHLDQVNSEVLEKAGIDPPPYSPAIMNRRGVSPDPPLYEATSPELHSANSLDRGLSPLAGSQLRTAVSRDSSSSSLDSVYHSKKEMKAAYKAIRKSDKAVYKAEKKALKAERKTNKALMKGCC